MSRPTYIRTNGQPTVNDLDSSWTGPWSCRGYYKLAPSLPPRFVGPLPLIDGLCFGKAEPLGLLRAKRSSVGMCLGFGGWR